MTVAKQTRLPPNKTKKPQEIKNDRFLDFYRYSRPVFWGSRKRVGGRKEGKRGDNDGRREEKRKEYLAITVKHYRLSIFQDSFRAEKKKQN